MTPQEIRDMSAMVAEHFGWWKPGKCTVANVHCRHFGEPWFNSLEDFKAKRWAEHEIPPPDLTQPEWFVRLLKALQEQKHIVMFGDDVPCSILPRCETELVVGDADTPELALLKAAYQLIGTDKTAE